MTRGTGVGGDDRAGTAGAIHEQRDRDRDGVPRQTLTLCGFSLYWEIQQGGWLHHLWGWYQHHPQPLCIDGHAYRRRIKARQRRRKRS